MFQQAAPEVAGDASVEGAVPPAGEDVDEAVHAADSLPALVARQSGELPMAQVQRMPPWVARMNRAMTAERGEVPKV